VERTLVIDDRGNAVVLEMETTGVVVEDDDERGIAVQTAVRGVVLGNVLEQQRQPIPAIQSAPTPTITQPSYDDDDDDDEGCCSRCSCCCVVKWTLLTIFCLPFLPLICLCYCCCCRDTSDN